MVSRAPRVPRAPSVHQVPVAGGAGRSGSSVRSRTHRFQREGPPERRGLTDPRWPGAALDLPHSRPAPESIQTTTALTPPGSRRRKAANRDRCRQPREFPYRFPKAQLLKASGSTWWRFRSRCSDSRASSACSAARETLPSDARSNASRYWRVARSFINSSASR